MERSRPPTSNYTPFGQTFGPKGALPSPSMVEDFEPPEKTTARHRGLKIGTCFCVSRNCVTSRVLFLKIELFSDCPCDVHAFHLSYMLLLSLTLFYVCYQCSCG